MEVKHSLTDMVVLAFDDENGANQGRQKLVELNNEYVLNLVDAVAVVGVGLIVYFKKRKR
jgi:uncharacterized membrane protein